MNRRTVMTAVAVILALVGTAAVYGYVRNADSRAVAGQQPVAVLIVDKLIPAGTSARAVRTGGYVKADHVPADATPEGSVKAIGADWQGDVATAAIRPGQVVLRTMFGAKVATTSGLAIPAGKVAVSVKLTTDGDVAGYVQPGSQVAIFDTFVLLDGKGVPSGSKTSSDKKDNWATKLLLPRVEVLAVSQGAPHGVKAGLDNGNTGAVDTLLVTVAVSQTDAERLIHVAQTGMPYAALLSDSSTSRPAPGVDNQGRLGSVFAGGIRAR
jgi:pilus assembly protein CpaB